jgi:hypothetical protein
MEEKEDASAHLFWVLGGGSDKATTMAEEGSSRVGLTERREIGEWRGYGTGRVGIVHARAEEREGARSRT